MKSGAWEELGRRVEQMNKVWTDGQGVDNTNGQLPMDKTWT